MRIPVASPGATNVVESASPHPLPVLVFTREPRPGKVKTRLIPAIGAERACALHCALLRRTVLTALAADVGPVILWSTPGTGHPFLRALVGELAIEARRQSGGNLGQRMQAALSATLEGGHRRAVVVGSDCPFITAGDYRRAAAALDDGDDAVIGPARDGGYFLLAVRKADAGLFGGIAWGGARVLADTRSNLRNLGWRWSELPARDDIDREEDLVLVRERAPELMAALAGESTT